MTLTELLIEFPKVKTLDLTYENWRELKTLEDLNRLMKTFPKRWVDILYLSCEENGFRGQDGQIINRWFFDNFDVLHFDISDTGDRLICCGVEH